ncbi:MAG: AI-2E family transporter [Deltaproteobacteria bacterium]|jgi:predicted PurR-regulated permease PerM
MNDPSNRNLKLWCFLAIFLLSALMLGWLMWPFISVIVLAAVVTSVFSAVFQFFRRFINASLSSLLTCVLIFLILFVPMVYFVGALSQEAYGLYEMGKDAVISDQLEAILANNRLIERANQFLSRFNYVLTGDEINKTVSEMGKVVGFFLYQQASAIASNILNFLFYFFFMLMFIYYFLVDGDKLVAFVIDFSPLPDDQDQILIQKFKNMAGAILIGNGLSGLIQGLAGGILFSLFGLKSPVLWGVIMSLVAFLPIIGTGVVFIPAAIYLYLTDRFAAGIFFVVFYLVLSVIMEYIFKPKLVGHRVNMHTLMVFLSVMGGVKLFGILGIIYGPLVVTAFLTLTDIYHTSYQFLVENKSIETIR